MPNITLKEQSQTISKPIYPDATDELSDEYVEIVGNIFQNTCAFQLFTDSLIHQLHHNLKTTFPNVSTYELSYIEPNGCQLVFGNRILTISVPTK